MMTRRKKQTEIPHYLLAIAGLMAFGSFAILALLLYGLLTGERLYRVGLASHLFLFLTFLIPTYELFKTRTISYKGPSIRASVVWCFDHFVLDSETLPSIPLEIALLATECIFICYGPVIYRTIVRSRRETS